MEGPYDNLNANKKKTQKKISSIFQRFSDTNRDQCLTKLRVTESLVQIFAPTLHKICLFLVNSEEIPLKAGDSPKY